MISDLIILNSISFHYFVLIFFLFSIYIERRIIFAVSVVYKYREVETFIRYTF